MKARSGVFTAFIFILLAVILLFQILEMIQSDRLYERVNLLEDSLKNTATYSVTPAQRTADSLPMPERYPGPEGDWLIWRFSAEPQTLNPINVEGDIYSRWITGGNIHENLLVYDYDEVRLKPWLAESFEVSKDGLEITITLRDNIYFSDGVPITTDDILFTYETVMNPGVDAADLRNYYKDIKTVQKIDKRTVRFIFSNTYWKSVEVAGLFEVLPKHIYKFDDPSEFNQRRSDPVGSGPYVFEKWDVGREIVLRRNERYWGTKPNLKKVVYRFITNDLAAVQALRSHQVDMIIPSPDQYADMSADAEFVAMFHALAYWNPGIPYFFIAWNQATPYFKDRRVRLALTHTINREAMVKHLLKGNARIVTGPFYINGPQNDPSIKPWPFDLEKAGQLLDEAGWRDTDGDGIRDKNGKPFKFNYSITSGNAIFERIAKLFKDDAAKVGIEVIPDPLEWSIFIERINARKFQAASMGWGGAILEDPYQIWHSSQIEGRGNNFIGFRQAEADALIEEARRTMDAQKRNALYFRFHRLLHEEQPYTFLFTRPTFRFVDRRFENVVVHKLGLDYYEWYVPTLKQKYK